MRRLSGFEWKGRGGRGQDEKDSVWVVIMFQNVADI
jgi:hypothetical protein